jgi:hypothetical protein
MITSSTGSCITMQRASGNLFCQPTRWNRPADINMYFSTGYVSCEEFHHLSRPASGSFSTTKELNCTCGGVTLFRRPIVRESPAVRRVDPSSVPLAIFRSPEHYALSAIVVETLTVSHSKTERFDPKTKHNGFSEARNHLEEHAH